MQYNPHMVVRISHLVIGLVVVAVLVGGAFSFGKKWDAGVEGDVQSAAAAAVETENADSDVASSTRELYSVVKVIDGDTITIAMGGTKETVRLIGIDTPETNDTRTGVQCFGKEASETLKSLLTGKKVYIEMDEGQGERDKYRRLLAYVFRDDGLHTNKYLIEEGYAYEYTYDTAYKYQKEFRAAEANAKTAKKGLWAPNACPEVSTAPEVKGAASVSISESKKEPTPVSEPKQEVSTPLLTQQSVPMMEPETQPAQEPAQTPAPAPQNSSYMCSANTYNCSDFKTHAEAQAVFEQCGGASNDIHKLDSNKDGEACESLP